MKYITTSILLAASIATGSAFAGPENANHHHGKGGHHNHHRHSDIVAPIILGTIIGYGVSQAQRRDDPPQVYQTPPVVIHNPPPIYVHPQPRIVPLARGAEPVYDKRVQYEPSCSCNVEVWVQIGWR